MRLLNPLLLIALIFMLRSSVAELENLASFTASFVAVGLIFITVRERMRLVYDDPPLDWRFVEAMKRYHANWHTRILSRVLRLVLVIVLAAGEHTFAAFLVLLSLLVRIGFDRNLSEMLETPREARGSRKGFKSGDEQ